MHGSCNDSFFADYVHISDRPSSSAGAFHLHIPNACQRAPSIKHHARGLGRSLINDQNLRAPILRTIPPDCFLFPDKPESVRELGDLRNLEAKVLSLSGRGPKPSQLHPSSRPPFNPPGRLVGEPPGVVSAGCLHSLLLSTVLNVDGLGLPCLESRPFGSVHIVSTKNWLCSSRSEDSTYLDGKRADAAGDPPKLDVRNARKTRAYMCQGNVCPLPALRTPDSKVGSQAVSRNTVVGHDGPQAIPPTKLEHNALKAPGRMRGNRLRSVLSSCFHETKVERIADCWGRTCAIFAKKRILELTCVLMLAVGRTAHTIHHQSNMGDV